MLRKIRIVLALAVWAGVTLLLLGIGQDWWGWMAKVQFIPAVWRLVGGFTIGNLLLIAGILLATFIFGRIYCSVICPLGVFQDIVIWLRRRLGLAINKINVRRAKKAAAMRKDNPESNAKASTLKPLVKHFKQSPERRWPRYAILTAAVVSAFVAGQLLLALIGPYSTYGRAVRALAGDSLPPAFLVSALLTIAAVTICAWFWGRAWCNVICPVGTLLGTVSRHSLTGIRIDADKCNACGRCVRGCKSSCIDLEHHSVDRSRCVDCFDCIGRCKEGAISFGTISSNGAGAGNADGSRRGFLKAAGIITATTVSSGLKAQEKKVDGGLAPLEDKIQPDRGGLLVPPGAMSAKNFKDRCIGCQLCVGACPNGVLRPGDSILDLFQPRMGYDKGWCRPECTACSQACPAGAIRPIGSDGKAVIRIGVAVVDPELCLAARGEVGCGNCTRHCPSGAIIMVKDASTGHRRPVVNEQDCIGCGACEFLCPVRPLSAITVKALETHTQKL